MNVEVSEYKHSPNDFKNRLLVTTEVDGRVCNNLKEMQEFLKYFTVNEMKFSGENAGMAWAIYQGWTLGPAACARMNLEDALKQLNEYSR